MTDRHLLIVHTAGNPAVFAHRLKLLGFRLSLIKKRPTDADRCAFDHVFDCDYQLGAADFLACVEAVNRTAKVDGVLSFSESGVIPVSLAARHLGLAGNSMSAAIRARNKFLMRSAFAAAGLANPEFAVVSSADEVVARLREWGGEAVLKPLSGSSSYGVVRLSPSDSYEKVVEVYATVVDYIRNYRTLNLAYPFEFWLPDETYGVAPGDVFDPESTLLLESFIPGQQVSVDGIISGDMVSCFGVIEIERIKDPRYFLETESWMPTRFGAAKEEEIEIVAARATRALGLRSGGFHCELKVSAEHITVIEVAARRGADNVSDFVLKTTGVDVYAEAARLACGEHREHASAAPNCAMGMRYFLPPSSGRLERVDGLEVIRDDPRVSELVIEFESGALVAAPPDGYEFLGYLSVTASDRDDAARVLDELCAEVKFHIVPPTAAKTEQVV